MTVVHIIHQLNEPAPARTRSSVRSRRAEQ